MALMRINFFSEALGKHHHFNLILPEQSEHYDMNAVPPLLPSVMILYVLRTLNATQMNIISLSFYRTVITVFMRICCTATAMPIILWKCGATLTRYFPCQKNAGTTS